MLAYRLHGALCVPFQLKHLVFASPSGHGVLYIYAAQRGILTGQRALNCLPGRRDLRTVLCVHFGRGRRVSFSLWA